MGYRLDIYKNTDDKENNIYYGTKLIGYVDNEADLLCIKYLCSIREDLDPYGFGYYYSQQVELTYDEFETFINLYFFDLAHDYLHEPPTWYKSLHDYDYTYKIICDSKKILNDIFSKINRNDKIIVGWC